jgi:hypothetical protein
MATRQPHSVRQLARLPFLRLPWRERRPRGQSLVEFALVLPMLLVLLLGIADFGRVFAAGITIEASARNGAEAAAQQYVQILRNKATVEPSDYASLHSVALTSVCNEADRLPNKTISAGGCTMPAAAVCVHDQTGGDVGCGSEATTAPPECTQLRDGWPNPAPVPVPTDQLGYVEVRVCYHFTILFPELQDLKLPFGWGLSLGDVYLQKSRAFTIGCYPMPTGACN